MGQSKVNEVFLSISKLVQLQEISPKITQYVPLLKKYVPLFEKICTFLIISYVSGDESVFFSENAQRYPYYYLNQRF